MKKNQIEEMISKIGGDFKAPHIFHKAGCNSISLPCEMGNTGRTLIANGWRNYDQLRRMLNRHKFSDTTVHETTVVVAASEKKVTNPKNPKTKLFQFIDGIYKRITS